MASGDVVLSNDYARQSKSKHRVCIETQQSNMPPRTCKNPGDEHVQVRMRPVA
jgi:hypothetical protein